MTAGHDPADEGGLPDPRIEFFNAHAAKWDTCGPPEQETIARLARLNDEWLGLKPGLDVLEVGCGTGQVTGWIAETVRPGRVTAIDFSPAMLERAGARRLEAEFRCVDVCSGLETATGETLGPSTYDVVFCMHAFPHFRDQETALRHLAESLHPGGSLLVLHLCSRCRVNTMHDEIGHPVSGDHLPSVGGWRDLLGQAGLTLIRIVDDEPGDLFFVKATRKSI